RPRTVGLVLSTLPTKTVYQNAAHSEVVSRGRATPAIEEARCEMATSQIGNVIQQVRKAVLLRDGAGLTDGQLLEAYVSRRDEAALAALVRRHGPMVWGVCHRLVRNHHDAEDAFQATFLVLVRKAATVASRELLANWLY